MAEKIFKVRKNLTENEIAVLLMLAALLFGVWLRVAPAFAADFPLNDGGMFYSMIRDLRQNGYVLPAFTSYNNLGIPYAYPPLPFYLAGWLADLFKVSDLVILLWLPALVNILTLPAFALLANVMLGSRIKTSLATFFYALMPLSMDWFLMGGGLTRGLGQLFLILTCWGAYRLFTSHSRQALLATILSGTLVVLCHPESALLAVTSVGILWLFSPRRWQNIPRALLVGAGVALLCAPWIVYVLRLHGVGPFVQAMQTSGTSLFMWTAIFTFDFTQESGLALLAVLGLIGLFIQLSKREYLLPVWVVLPFFINPRSSARASIIPLAMLAAASLLDVILPAMQAKSGPKNNSNSFVGYLFLGYIFIYLLANGYGLDQRIIANHLDESDRLAMLWVGQNTPPDSKFIILTGEPMMMRDPVQEWFPVLTERRSQTTLQGWEWISGRKFNLALSNYQGLIQCFQQDLACVIGQATKLDIPFDYIYIKKRGTTSASAFSTRGLVSELTRSPGIQEIFENETVIIFSLNE